MSAAMRVWGCVVLSIAVAVSGAAAMSISARPAGAERVPAGAGAASPRLSVSADGRFVAFESLVRLTSEDVNAVSDVYVLDRETGELSLETGPGGGGNPQLSGDGRFIVFSSASTLLTEGVPNAFESIYLRDRVRGTVRCLSRAPDDQPANGGSSGPTISADGRTVAFTSQATNLVSGAGPAIPAGSTTPAGSNGPGATHSNIYLWRADQPTLSRLSLDGIDVPIVGAYDASLQADGEQIAFTVMLVSFETPDRTLGKQRLPRRNATRVYVRDLRGGAITRVGCATADGCTNGRDFRPALSADGRFVTFVSSANDRVPDDGNQLADVFLFDLRTRSTLLVSRTPSGRSGNGGSSFPAVSGDGRFVAFESRASDLDSACGARRCSGANQDENLVLDVFLFDRTTATITRLSRGEEPWWDASVAPAIDASGRVVAFSSAQSTGSDDWRGDFDLYVWAEDPPLRLRQPTS